MTNQADQTDRGTKPSKGWRSRLRTARRPLRRLAILLILALIVEYLVIPELVGASKDLYLLGRLNVWWMIAGLILEGLSLFCYALLNRVLLPPEGRPSLSRLFRIDLSAAAVAHVIPAGTVGSAGIGYQLFTAEGVDGTDVGVMMATKGMGSTVVLNVLLWIALVISIPLSGFRPVYATVAIVGAVVLAVLGALIFGVTRGEKRAARILYAIGQRIPGVGGERLEQIALRAASSIRDLGTNREVLVWSVTWASLNWLLDAASLWCFIAAFGGHANPVGLFAAYGVANVIGAIPITPGGLGIIDTITPVLLVGFGLTRSVATLGVLAWRLVNFWLPIPTGALAYVSLKVPRGAGVGAMRRALSDLIPKAHRVHQQAPADGQADTHEYPDGQAPGPRPAAADGSPPAADDAAADSRDARR
ncbi:MAG TPA: lysylphosphatidylglycerol synthase transmembrane domain-containing protein [Streptosporangiaceae bacterium]|nr:lysylphosphatidylglycerol synthase transmembrane domain-containing protein [Streptosporangiaceae bacterium]